MKRAVALGLAVLLAACGSPINGTVIQKDHKDAWTSYTTVSTGKTTTIVPNHHPERWRFKVRSPAKGRTKWVTVPERLWSTTAIGDQYSESAQ